MHIGTVQQYAATQSTTKSVHSGSQSVYSTARLCTGFGRHEVELVLVSFSKLLALNVRL